MCRRVVQGIVHKAAIFENMRIFTVNNESLWIKASAKCINVNVNKSIKD